MYSSSVINQEALKKGACVVLPPKIMQSLLFIIRPMENKMNNLVHFKISLFLYTPYKVADL